MIQFNLLQAASSYFEIETCPRMQVIEMKNEIDHTTISKFCQNMIKWYRNKKVDVITKPDIS